MAWFGLAATTAFSIVAITAPLYFDDATAPSTFAFVIALFCYELIYQRRR